MSCTFFARSTDLRRFSSRLIASAPARVMGMLSAIDDPTREKTAAGPRMGPAAHEASQGEGSPSTEKGPRPSKRRARARQPISRRRHWVRSSVDFGIVLVGSGCDAHHCGAKRPLSAPQGFMTDEMPASLRLVQSGEQDGGEPLLADAEPSNEGLLEKPHERDHIVHFYEDDEFLFDAVAHFAAAGPGEGELFDRVCSRHSHVIPPGESAAGLVRSLEAELEQRKQLEGVLRDVLQKRAVAAGALEERSAQDNERFRLLVESVKDYAIFMLDAQGHVSSWNEGAQRIKGYRAEEIVGQHFSRCYPPEDAPRPEMEVKIASRRGRLEGARW